MSTIEAFGIGIDLPKGWDGQIGVAEPGGDGVHAAGVIKPVLHAANFPLPPDRGDFGSGAVEVMGRRGVFLAVLEYADDSASSALFSGRGLPRRLRLADFDPNRLQRALAGQAGAQVFFREAGRAFCLYAVIGSYEMRRTLVPVVNDVLATVSIS